MSATAEQDRKDPIPADAGLSQGGKPESDERRGGRELVDHAADGHTLTERESDDLVAYYLSNDELPGDTDTQTLTVTLGHGPRAREFRCEVRPIEWDEWQDARTRATNVKTGEFDAYVSSSWNVARALVKPALGATVTRLQSEDPKKAPANAAELLQRMFRKQSGALLELSGKVLEISKLQNDANSVKEVEAAKN